MSKRAAPASSARASGKKRKGVENANLRELTKVVGDALKDGLHVGRARAILSSQSKLGDLTFYPVSLATFTALVGAAPKPSGGVRLSKPRLITIFGAAKIEKGGGQSERFDVSAATFLWDSKKTKDDMQGELTVRYAVEAMGSNVWWKNKRQ